jgi:hypothetical protein
MLRFSANGHYAKAMDATACGTEAAYIATIQAEPISTATSQINEMRNSRVCVEY